MIPVALFWLSFAVTAAAVVMAVAVVRASKGAILSSVAWWFLLGISLFAVHHVVELFIAGETAHIISETMEKMARAGFLVGALLLARTLWLLSAPTGSE